MSRSRRKRHNPLEEIFAETESAATEHAVAGMGAPEAAEGTAPVERIERLPPSRMIPDRFQPRRVLPAAIRRRFFAGEIDCYQAAAEWLDLARRDPGWRARVEELLAMGDSFDAHGQIKPITGVWVPAEDGSFLFQIETGERRYWAACLRAVRDGLEHEPLLRVEVVDRPTRHRQVLENRHALEPSAVGQACEIAALLLEAVGVEPDPGLEDEFDYFRLALEQRAPHRFWPTVEPVMQLSARRMQQLLQVLRLPTPLLELADRHRVPERVLREVLALPPEAWETALRAAVEGGLTAEEVAALEPEPRPAPPEVRRPRDDARRSPQRVAFSGLRRFLRGSLLVEDGEARRRLLDELADELTVQGMAGDLVPLLRELVALLEARRSRQ